MIRVVLPAHLRTLARITGEVQLEVEGAATQRSVLDALEARYPMLEGTLRDHVTKNRRPFVRFFACEEDLSNDPPDAPLPAEVASGREPFLVVGAVAGGSAPPAAAVTSNKGLWAGRILSGLFTLFLLLDGVLHLLKPAQVAEAFSRLGYRLELALPLGIIELVCTLIYVIPRTSVLGAILLTGYLGGATASHVRAGDPVFDTCFPIGVGVLLWLGLFLRDARLRRLIPVATRIT